MNNFVHMYFHVGGLSLRVDCQILDQNVFREYVLSHISEGLFSLLLYQQCVLLSVSKSSVIAVADLSLSA